jgi:hypothetical protein
MDGSPAIDAGSCTSDVAVDQRGTARNAPCDIGAFESDGTPTINTDITFTLIDASSDAPVPGYDPIANGMNIPRTALPAELSVRADVPGNPGSVVFDFNDVSNFRTEHVTPYSLFGDLEGDYRAQPLSSGLQRITATPYPQPSGRGQAWPAGSVSFTIVDSENAITRFVLVDADTDQDVWVLESNMTVSVQDLPENLNVRAETGSATRSVRFAVGENSRMEVIPPFALFGDLAGDYLSGPVPPGSYTLIATPYDESGTEGVSLALNATIIDESNPESVNDSGTMWLPPDEYVILSSDPEATPDAFQLSENYPNPFNPTTTFSYSVPQTGPVQLAIFNVIGQQIQTLVDGVVPSGVHQVNFEAVDLPSGIYLYRLKTSDGALVRKMILAK